MLKIEQRLGLAESGGISSCLWIDDTTFALGHNDGTLTMWSMAKKAGDQRLMTVEFHTLAVVSLAVDCASSPVSVYSASLDGIVAKHILSRPFGERPAVSSTLFALASPLGACVAAHPATTGLIVIGSEGGLTALDASNVLTANATNVPTVAMDLTVISSVVADQRGDGRPQTDGGLAQHRRGLQSLCDSGVSAVAFGPHPPATAAAYGHVGSLPPVSSMLMTSSATAIRYLAAGTPRGYVLVFKVPRASGDSIDSTSRGERRLTLAALASLKPVHVIDALCGAPVRALAFGLPAPPTLTGAAQSGLALPFVLRQRLGVQSTSELAASDGSHPPCIHMLHAAAGCIVATIDAASGEVSAELIGASSEDASTSETTAVTTISSGSAGVKSLGSYASAGITALSVGSASGVLAVGHCAGAVRLWDTKSVSSALADTPVHSWSAGTGAGAITALAFNRTGGCLIVATALSVAAILRVSSDPSARSRSG